MIARRPTCHPDREHYGNGWCRKCYYQRWSSPTSCVNHPDRPQRATGLCGMCYEKARRTRTRGQAPEKRHVRPPATCHPERPHFARGQCRQCWRMEYERIGRGRDMRLARQAGLPPGNYDVVHRLQDGQCLICGAADKKLVVDHDHRTGMFRGLLCSNCNSLLGYAKDNIHTLMRAIAYLQQGEKCRTAS